MKKNIFCLITLCPGLFLAGCATSNDVTALNIKIAALSEVLNSVQTNQADLSEKMDSLSRDITMSNENVKDLDFQMARLSSRLDDISIVLSDRAAAEAEKKKVLLPSQLFEEAQSNMSRGNMDTALEGFELYLKTYPEGEYVQKSRYMMGDIYFSEKKYHDAAIEYATLLKDFPKSKETASYRLKYAKAIVPLKKTAEAKKYLQSIEQDFPKSPEAKLAKEALASIK